MTPFLSRVRRRLDAERWILELLRGQPGVRRLRGGVEQVRMARLRRRSGSVEAALDQIVQEAHRP